MITSLYAAICAMILMNLSYKVIQLRRKHKVSLGDGDIKELETAIAAHANATEYIPITLILLFLFEYNEANLWLVNIVAIVFIIGRLLHAYGISRKFEARVPGMQITIYSIAALSVLNVISLIAN